MFGYLKLLYRLDVNAKLRTFKESFKLLAVQTGMVFLAAFLVSSFARADKAVIINDGAYVYRQADFDAEVLATVSEGKTFEVSRKLTNGAFFKIKLKGRTIGFIADTDVKFLSDADDGEKSNKKNKKDLSKDEDSQKNKKSKTKKRPKSFALTRYGGLGFLQIAHKEDTMGAIRSESLAFYDIKLTGPNILFEGNNILDIDFFYHRGAPSYYKKKTGNPTDGTIMIADFLFLTTIKHSDDILLFYGFGPMVKLSQFFVQLDASSPSDSPQAYSLDDIVLGAVFNAGLGLRWGRFAARPEVRYFWEKQQYMGYGLSFQIDF